MPFTDADRSLSAAMKKTRTQGEIDSRFPHPLIESEPPNACDGLVYQVAYIVVMAGIRSYEFALCVKGAQFSHQCLPGVVVSPGNDDARAAQHVTVSGRAAPWLVRAVEISVKRSLARRTPLTRPGCER
jgi:hypothetical protein